MLLDAFCQTSCLCHYYIITLCNLMQQKKKLCQSFSSSNTFHNLIPTEIQHLFAWLSWTTFSVTWLYFYMLLCWHGRFGRLLSLRQTPTRPVELLKQGVNYSSMVYAASRICNFIPVSKVLQATTYSIHLLEILMANKETFWGRGRIFSLKLEVIVDP